VTIERALKKAFPADRLSDHPDTLRVAASDESTLPPVMPRLVVWPADAAEVLKVVKLCNEHSVPITTRGGGSALEGSAIPSEGAIVLDLSRQTEILDYWPDDLQVRVQPGLIYDNLNDRLKRDGLFFPPSPGGSGDLATIGGMVSTNASGIYSVKYGATKRYVLALEVVTGAGELLTLGNRAEKRSSGYNLLDLIAGSEGTLAIITSVTLKLAGIPEGRYKCAFKFPTNVAAAGAVSEMRKYGLDVAAIEFLDKALLEALNKLKGYGLEESPSLFLEFHGPQAAIDASRETAEALCRDFDGVPFSLAGGQNPWEIRHFATDAIKHRKPGYSIIRNDIAFPISYLPDMVDFCHSKAAEADIMMHTFGHVGMGLLHALMLADKKNSHQWQAAQRLNDLIIEKALEVGGTISGEHGIGLGHKNLFEREHGLSVGYMRRIKQQFDPSNILNPGKIFDL
jgi:D-lactate dehydrogenase (cytochrome)